MERNLRYAIESIEFTHYGLFRGGNSEIRVKKLDINQSDGIITADIEVCANGGNTEIKNEHYHMFGLQTWINALSNSA